VVHAGAVRWADDDAVEVVLVPGFVVGGAVVVAQGLDQPDAFAVVLAGGVDVDDPDHDLARPHHTGDRHGAYLRGVVAVAGQV
jgi:hypothetical protein